MICDYIHDYWLKKIEINFLSISIHLFIINILQDIQKAMEVFSLQQRAAKTPEEALHKQYRFWYTQPVPKMSKYF